MSKQDRLGGMLREIENPLGEVLQKAPYRGGIDADLQLRYTQCGLATAVLHRYLEMNGEHTERVVASLDGLPPRNDGTTRKHVVLLDDNHNMIDPTFGQYFRFIGLTTALAQQYPDMKCLFPPEKIIKFPQALDKEFGREMGQFADLIRPKVLHVLGSRSLNFWRSKPEIFENVPVSTLIPAYESIWRTGRYMSFTTAFQDKYIEPGFQAAVNDIADSM